MLNKEKYKDELEQILENGYILAFDKKHDEIIPCSFIPCSRCKFSTNVGCAEKRKEWLNSEYVEPEVDWSKIPVDTPILVRHNENQNWNKRYFAEYDHGIVRAWTCGRTSWNAGGGTLAWNYAKLAEDINKGERNGEA